MKLVAVLVVVVQHHVAELARHFVVVVKVVEPEKQLNVVVHLVVKLAEHVEHVEHVDIEDKNLIQKSIPKTNSKKNNK